MDRDTIIRLAREAGVKPLLYDGKWAVEGLDVFAALVAAHEREECAKVCDRIYHGWLDCAPEDEYKTLHDAEDCAAAIRSRK